MDIQTATPAEIDAELARLGGELAEQHRILSQAMSAQARQRAGRILAGTYDEATLRRTISQAADKMADLEVQRQPLNREFERRGGWTRYYLVDSHNGHVHRDLSYQRCSRTPSTDHVWLTDQSGMPAFDLVELAGDRACTVCFSWAPVEVLKRASVFTPPSVEEKQARQAERDRKAAARKAKEITNPDGSPLVVVVSGWREQIKTVVAAQRQLSQFGIRPFYYGCAQTEQERDAINTILAALAHKLGTTVEEQRAEYDKRLAARRRREGV